MHRKIGLLLYFLFVSILVPAQTAEEHFQNAEEYIFDTRYKKAVRELAKALEQDPENIIYKKRKAFCHEQLKEGDDAVKEYLDIILNNPDDTNTLHLLGMAYIGLGEFKKTIECFDKILEMHPNCAELYFERAIAKKEDEDYKGARADLSKAVSLNTIYADVHIMEGIDKFLSDKKEEACDIWLSVGGIAQIEAEHLIVHYCKKYVKVKTKETAKK